MNKELETSKLSLRGLSLVSPDVVLVVLLACYLCSSVSDWEVIVFDVVIVLLALWLTVCKRHDEEVRLELLDSLAFHNN